jgi:hypothetical protein
VADESRDDLDRRLDEIADLIGRLPPDNPEVVHCLADAARLLFAFGTNRSALSNERVAVSYQRLGERWPADHPMTHYAIFMSRSVGYMRALLAGDTVRADIMLVEMARSANIVPTDHPLLPFVLFGVATAYIERHSLNGDLRNLDLATDAIDKALAAAARVGGPSAPGTLMHGFLLRVRGHVRMAWSVYDPRLSRVNAAIKDLEQALAQIGPEQAARTDLTSVLDIAWVMHEQLTAPSGPGRPLGPRTSLALGRLLDTAETMGRDRVEYPTVAAQAAAGLAMRALSGGDVPLLSQAIAQLSDACRIPGLGLRERPRLLQLHGFALQTRYHLIRDPRDLSNAISILEEARRAVEQELASPSASGVLLFLADAYRTRAIEALGDTDRAVRVGLAGLRRHADDVLLQDSDENALHRARLDSDNATGMARWFLARGRHEAAIGAIELGRGIVLHAATSGSSVTEALVAAGHPALAAAWDARAGGPGQREMPGHGSGADEADDDLRYRAMRALEGTSAEATLLSPPALDDIAAALARSGTDLLGYLLPQEGSGTGMATGMTVLIDRLSCVRWIPLPWLRVGAGSMTDEFVRARRAAEATSAEALVALRARWLKTLDTVCDWAWEAAVGPLLNAASAHGAARPPRIVLIPMGQLGLIPWHAARRSQGGSSPRYACQDAIFSYASSARQFVEASLRRPRPWPQAPVLISDSDHGSFPDATLEVAHLFAAHYRGGTVFGSARDALPAHVPGKAPASPDDVLAALPGGSSPGASLLHFGCHGRVAVPVLEASLRLGAGDRETAVSIRDILRQARAAPRSARNASGGLVILAACLTDVTEADYDEALTLATAFLAAGSTGVVAARWAVPDASTKLFMVTFHRFLNAANADPAHALREAQLWMLDPAREIPAAWPEPLKQQAARLAAHRAGTGLAGVEAWAAFSYQGR